MEIEKSLWDLQKNDSSLISEYLENLNFDLNCPDTTFIPRLGTNMSKNTSILLGEHFEEYIATKVASGKFSSASEVVRTALRLMQTEEEKLKQLKKALTAGEKSGFVKNFDREAHLKRMHDKFL